MTDVVELSGPERYDRYLERSQDALDALVLVCEDSEVVYEPQRKALLGAVEWLEIEVSCGDCIEGRCHFGGDRSRASTAAASAGEEYVDPKWGPCGCARHEVSVEIRNRRRRWAADGNKAETAHP